MSDDIRAGDVVVCVDTAPRRPKQNISKIRRGGYYRVTGLTVTRFLRLPAITLGVHESDGREITYAKDRFRKIDAPKTEISERIKACRPVKVGEDA